MKGNTKKKSENFSLRMAGLVFRQNKANLPCLRIGHGPWATCKILLWQVKQHMHMDG